MKSKKTISKEWLLEQAKNNTFSRSDNMTNRHSDISPANDRSYSKEWLNKRIRAGKSVKEIAKEAKTSETIVSGWVEKNGTKKSKRPHKRPTKKWLEKQFRSGATIDYMLEKHGFPHWLTEKWCKDYGIDVSNNAKENPNKNKKWLSAQLDSGWNLEDIARVSNVDVDTVDGWLVEFNLKLPRTETGRMKQQSRFTETVKSIYRGEVSINDTSVIHPKELDLYLPDKDIAFEFNGFYWHTEISGNKPKDYHYDKADECIENNISLYSVTDIDFKHRQKVVKRAIRAILNKDEPELPCRIRKIDSVEQQKYLQKFVVHIPGNLGRWALVAEDDNEVREMMCFSERDDESALYHFQIRPTTQSHALPLYIDMIGEFDGNKLLYVEHNRLWGRCDAAIRRNFDLIEVRDNFYCIKSGQNPKELLDPNKVMCQDIVANLDRYSDNSHMDYLKENGLDIYWGAGIERYLLRC